VRMIERTMRRIVYEDKIFSVYEMFSYLRYRSLIEKVREKNDLKLHLGCGGKTLAGWINIDMQLKSEILTMKLPRGLKRFDESSARCIYTSHFLEHLEYPRDALEFVKQCYRILIPGGGLRIVVPGIEKIISAYVRDNRDFFKLQEEMHPSWCTTKLEHLMYALQQDGQHKFGYDFETMGKLLSQAGFKNIVQSGYNQSEVEDLRIDYRAKMDEAGEYLSLYVDAFK